MQSTLPSGQTDYAFDRGCFYVLEPNLRTVYASQVARILAPGGLLFLKTFDVDEPRPLGPYQFSAEQIGGIFDRSFQLVSQRKTVFQGTLDPSPKALFCVLEKRESPDK